MASWNINIVVVILITLDRRSNKTAFYYWATGELVKKIQLQTGVDLQYYWNEHLKFKVHWNKFDSVGDSISQLF